MARGDIKGRKQAWGQNRINEVKQQAEDLEQAAESESNLDVGDFLSELTTAITYKAKANLTEGDWLEDPERAYTDGYAFGQEIRTAIQGKLQISLSLDCSTSMWVNQIMKYAGPTFAKMDAVIRKAIADVPEGALVYDAFIFHERAHRLPQSFIQRFHGQGQKLARGPRAGSVAMSWPVHPYDEDVAKAIELGEIPANFNRANFFMSGTKTKIASLFGMLREWEERFSDPTAKRLDIVLTDGVLDDIDDVKEASRIQEIRNGDLTTVCLNFLPPHEWGGNPMPDRVIQYAVNAENLSARLRDMITETINEM